MIFRNGCNAAIVPDSACRLIRGAVSVVDGISPAELDSALAGRASTVAVHILPPRVWSSAS